MSLLEVLPFANFACFPRPMLSRCRSRGACLDSGDDAHVAMGDHEAGPRSVQASDDVREVLNTSVTVPLYQPVPV